MTAEIFAEKLIPLFKSRGYKKRRLTWYKRNCSTTIVFWLQKSQYSSDVWFYNYCVGINDFFDHEITSYDHCDIFCRLNQVECNHRLTENDLINYLDYWEKEYDDLKKIKEKMQADNLPIDCSLRLKEHLKTCN